MMDFEILKQLITKHSSYGIELGTSDNSPSDEWIHMAESTLKIKLPQSYIWFLKNYGGGEIAGDEIFSIYQLPFDESLGGDLVFQRNNIFNTGAISESEIPIMCTDFGELYVFDSLQADSTGEFPIYLKLGESRKLFANNFATFLEMKIKHSLES